MTGQTFSDILIWNSDYLQIDNIFFYKFLDKKKYFFIFSVTLEGRREAITRASVLVEGENGAILWPTMHHTAPGWAGDCRTEL